MFAKLKGFSKVLNIKQKFLETLKFHNSDNIMPSPAHKVGTLFGCKKDSVTCQLIQLL